MNDKKDNYNEDEELIILVKESNEAATDVLYNKYYYIIPLIIKKYRNILYSLEIDMHELTEEAIITLINAITSYSSNKTANLKTYINLCIERKIRSIISKKKNDKTNLQDNALSLDYNYKEDYQTLKNFISDNNKNNPETLLTQEENYIKFIQIIEQNLSKKEKIVLEQLLNGLSNKEISEILDIDYKKINNTISRIRKKISNVIQNNKKVFDN